MLAFCFRFHKTMKPARTNFDNFFKAMLAVFQVSQLPFISFYSKSHNSTKQRTETCCCGAQISGKLIDVACSNRKLKVIHLAPALLFRMMGLLIGYVCMFL